MQQVGEIMDSYHKRSAVKVWNVVVRAMQQIGLRRQAWNYPLFSQAINRPLSYPEFKLPCRQFGQRFPLRAQDLELKLVVDCGDVLQQVPQVCSDAGGMDHPRIDADCTLHGLARS